MKKNGEWNEDDEHSYGKEAIRREMERKEG